MKVLSNKIFFIIIILNLSRCMTITQSNRVEMSFSDENYVTDILLALLLDGQMIKKNDRKEINGCDIPSFLNLFRHNTFLAILHTNAATGSDAIFSCIRFCM